MKVLKLTNTPKCRDLARALIGSPVLTNEDNMPLIGISSFEDAIRPFIIEDMVHFPDRRYINLPIHELEVSWGVCAELEIPVIGEANWRSPHTNSAIYIEGIINSINLKTNRACLGNTEVLLDSIILDLNNLPCGASLEEVGER